MCGSPAAAIRRPRWGIVLRLQVIFEQINVRISKRFIRIAVMKWEHEQCPVQLHEEQKRSYGKYQRLSHNYIKAAPRLLPFEKEQANLKDNSNQ